MMTVMKEPGFGNGLHLWDGGGEQQLEIRLPHCRVLRLVARSVLIATVVLSLPWIGTTTTMFNNDDAAKGKSSVSVATTPIGNDGGGVLLDDMFFLPMLFRDFRREGVFCPGTGKSVFLGRNAELRLPFLKHNELVPVDVEQRELVASNSVDFLFAADGIDDTATTMSFIERVLKPGGIAAVTLNTDSTLYFRLPLHHIPVYVRRFRSTIVAMRKTDNSVAARVPLMTGRNLLMFARSKKVALKEAGVRSPQTTTFVPPGPHRRHPRRLTTLDLRRRSLAGARQEGEEEWWYRIYRIHET